MRLKELSPDKYIKSAADWEEVPDEDLWEDGEIREGHSLAIKIYEQVVMEGNWNLIRRTDDK